MSLDSKTLGAEPAAVASDEDRWMQFGRLTPGIAHELRSSLQAMIYGLDFMREVLDDFGRLRECSDELAEADSMDELREVAARRRRLMEEIDVDFLVEEYPQSLKRSEEAVVEMTALVAAMRDYLGRERSESTLFDPNEVVETVLRLVHNELKYDAEVRFVPGSLSVVKARPEVLTHALVRLLSRLGRSCSAERKADGSRCFEVSIETSLMAEAVCIELRVRGVMTASPFEDEGFVEELQGVLAGAPGARFELTSVMDEEGGCRVLLPVEGPALIDGERFRDD